MRRLIILVALVALAASACGGDEGAGDLVTSLDVSMVEFEFDPAESVVPAGEAITLNLSNAGSVEHNWVVLASGAKIEAESELDESMIYFEGLLNPGEAETFTFTAPAPGGYQVICDVPGHFTAGMEGRLRVVDNG